MQLSVTGSTGANRRHTVGIIHGGEWEEGSCLVTPESGVSTAVASHGLVSWRPPIYTRHSPFIPPTRRILRQSCDSRFREPCTRLDPVLCPAPSSLQPGTPHNGDQRDPPNKENVGPRNLRSLLATHHSAVLRHATDLPRRKTRQVVLGLARRARQATH